MEKPLFAKYLLYIYSGLSSYKEINQFSKKYNLKPFSIPNICPYVKEFENQKWITCDNKGRKGIKSYTKNLHPNWDKLISEFLKRFNSKVDELLIDNDIIIQKVRALVKKKPELADKFDAIIFSKFLMNSNYLKENYSKTFKNDFLKPALKSYFELILLQSSFSQDYQKLCVFMQRDLTLSKLFDKFVYAVGNNLFVNTKTQITYKKAKTPEEEFEQNENLKLAEEIDYFIDRCRYFQRLTAMLDLSYSGVLSLKEAIKDNPFIRVEEVELLDF